MTTPDFEFNPPPGWPTPPPGWTVPAGWKPDPAWPPAPAGWLFWRPGTSAQTKAPAPSDRIDDSERTPSLSPTAPTVTTQTQKIGTIPSSTATQSSRAPNQSASPSKTAADRGPTLPGNADHKPPSPLDPQAGTTEPPAPHAREAAQAPIADSSDHADALAAARLRIADLERALAAATAQSGVGQSDDALIELDDQRILQAVGIYRYHHPLENAVGYRDKLADLQERIKTCVRDGRAVASSDLFTFNNSLAKGRKMTADLSKLMARAYNAEADNAVRSLRAGNVETAKRRVEATKDAVARLGSMMELRITDDFHQLRTEELELTSDYLMKVQEEREAAREERERLREERRASQELAAERDRLAKERAHYANALTASVASGDGNTEDLQRKLDDLDASIAHNDYRLANIRAGYVYVISNTGAFGPNVVKIGLTRRLDPLERVRELGGASVPFPFDVHALFFSGDAVTLETELHHAFAEQRVNRVNERREFFFATPAMVREALASRVGNLLEYTDEPEASQYLQSRKYWPQAP